MQGYQPNSYGDAFADVYDDWYPHAPEVDQAVAQLRTLANGGAVLELGCGTGRLCLPLAKGGLVVHGIDASGAMLKRLADKPNAADIVAHHVDMADFALVGSPPFALAFCAFNTFFNLATEHAQASCLASVARHLAPGGHLALECFVPGDPPADQLDEIELRDLASDRVVLRISRQDPSAQTVSGQHIELSERGVRLRPWHLRYATPSQLDQAAGRQGLELEHRWADWSGAPFGPDAANHVSVYRKAGSDG